MSVADILDNNYSINKYPSFKMYNISSNKKKESNSKIIDYDLDYYLKINSFYLFVFLVNISN